MAFQAIYLEALDGDVAVRYVGLAGQEKAVVAVRDAYFDIFDSPAADDDIGRRRDE